MAPTDREILRNRQTMGLVKLYNAAQSRELDRVSIEDFGIPGLQLMQSAGEEAFSRITSNFDDIEPVIVMCGPGNNGGDGYVVAECARSIGLDTWVVRSSEPGTDDARQMCQRFESNGGSVVDYQGCLPAVPGLVVDAMLGTGISRAPSGNLADLIRSANQAGSPIVALDLPSGLDSDTGHAFDPCISATMTVTFIGRKFGSFTAAGMDHCGALEYARLNVPGEVFEKVDATAWIIPEPVLPKRTANSHKRQFGDVAIVGGDSGMLGAVIMSGKAALRCGCGMVTLVSTSRHLDMPALQCPELMSSCAEDDEIFSRLLDRCGVVIIGPGLGVSSWSEAAYEKAMTFTGPMVVDADGLNLLSLSASRRDNWILTPHPGEAGSLLGCSAREVQENRLDAVNSIVSRYGGVCILKGAGSLVSSGTSPVWLCDRGNPGMASAGMGDVLSGIAGALLGLGLDPLEAAKAATWLHSAAADEVASRMYPGSLLATDVINQLPHMVIDR